MAFSNGAGAPRRRSDSVTDLPQGPADILVLIVARGCVEQFSGRFTHFAASAVLKAVVWAAKHNKGWKKWGRAPKAFRINDAIRSPD